MGLKDCYVFGLFLLYASFYGGVAVKPLLIIKTGTTFSSIRREHGDLDDFIINQLEIPADEIIVAPVFENKWLPGLDAISGVIITGSHSMVTDREEWSEYLAEWLRNIPCGSLPVLGICYGHQLLAHAFGGEIGYHPQGIEIGTVEIEVTEAGQQDPLLSALPNSFLGHVTHAQTVIRLPDQAKRLAGNNFEQHHAFVIGGNMWGVQFHPEFTAAIARAYIHEQQQKLVQDGHDVEQLQNMVQEHTFGNTLLKRFCELTRSAQKSYYPST